MTFIITFFREKRDDFAKIAALNAAFFDRTLRFFLPGFPSFSDIIMAELTLLTLI